ncbi:unnamed protein product [Lupinus luteus]|uniref:Uncharacterized protein n=1 Tax=Lupinus luteus TaxID=3873 RepID=A0AAV1WW56_LUPLU
MAEFCSSYPTYGGLYYWSVKLAGPRWTPFASWIIEWFNFVDQLALTTSLDYTLAQLVRVSFSSIPVNKIGVNIRHLNV